jgi:hypothetical protein
MINSAQASGEGRGTAFDTIEDYRVIELIDPTDFLSGRRIALPLTRSLRSRPLPAQSGERLRKQGGDHHDAHRNSNYDDLYRDFRREIPARFNMASACCDRHADGNSRTALIYVDEDGAAQRTSFDELRAMSCRFANVLTADGLARQVVKA